MLKAEEELKKHIRNILLEFAPHETSETRRGGGIADWTIYLTKDGLDSLIRKLADFILARDRRREEGIREEGQIAVVQLILNTCKYAEHEFYLSTNAVEQLLQDLQNNDDSHRALTALKKTLAELKRLSSEGEGKS